MVLKRYSTFGPRLEAGILDGLIFLPLALLGIYLSSPSRSPVTLIVWAVFWYSAGWLYSVSMHVRYGQTLGKMAAHVKVWNVAEDRLPSWGQALVRDIGDIVPSLISLAYFIYVVAAHKYLTREQANMGGSLGNALTYSGILWFLLEIVTMFTNQKRRALHDFLARTVVVRTA